MLLDLKIEPKEIVLPKQDLFKKIWDERVENNQFLEPEVS